MSGKVNKVKSG